MSGLANFIATTAPKNTENDGDEPPPLVDRDHNEPRSLLEAMGTGGDDKETLDDDEEKRLEEMFRTMDENSPFSGLTAKELGKLGNTDCTVLWDAVGRRDPTEVSRVARLTRDINHKFADYNNMTCLHKAVTYGPDVMPVPDCLRMVYAIVSNERCDLDAIDDDGATALHLAASSGGCWPAVMVLLEAGADAHMSDRDDLTPLHAAASSGHAPVVDALLARGADPKAASSEGWTVLHAAASEGKIDVIDVIMKAISSTAKSDDGDVPIIEIDGSTGMHLFDPVDSDGLSPLLVACCFGHLNCARKLLEVGADPTRKDSKGKSAVDLADWHSGREVEVAALLKDFSVASSSDSDSLSAIPIASATSDGE